MNWLKEFAINTAIVFFIGLKGNVNESKRAKFKAVALRLFNAIRTAYADDPDFN